MIAAFPGEESAVGLVLDEGLLVRLVAEGAGRLTHAEDFTGAPVGADSPAWDQAEVLPGYPFVRVLFTDRPGKAWDFRANFFVYAVSLLLLITTLGLLFSYRAVAHQVSMARLKSDFISTVSHELRTPLTGMQALLERLEAGKVSDPGMQSRYHHVMRLEVQRLAHMVDNLLDFARLEGGRRRLLREATDLNQLVEEVVGSFRNLGFGRRIRTLPSTGATSPTISAERAAIAQCLKNLVDNALKYSPEGSMVTVATSRASGEVVVAVTDEGPGVPISDQARIFEQFYRGSGDSRNRTGGAGLGLALVKRIVEAHGGRVDLTSEPDCGSTFSLVFPEFQRVGMEDGPSPPAVRDSSAGTGRE